MNHIRNRICPLQQNPPNSSKVLRDTMCGLRNIDWDSPMAKIGAWFLDRAPNAPWPPRDTDAAE